MSISSRPPVCSPTAIIEITIGGNTFDFSSGAAMVSPPAIDARDSMIASWMTRLPAVLAVISRPSRIDHARARSACRACG